MVWQQDKENRQKNLVGIVRDRKQSNISVLGKNSRKLAAGIERVMNQQGFALMTLTSQVMFVIFKTFRFKLLERK